ncbi:MAG: heat-inducible transcriptional repressor HrcA [Pseudomonadales bacterium]|jgi:heat-inducible transcriptional repressor|nr:heat-inducible transcriptional repressor HrcA [Pseudomonadales bacterium]MDP7359592.1 heat-inducible transcriptional repressor HrcA [Pseudomonadales bacterium]MDP7595807.1 heat-inducible transcriptional repressor HrcA [Pseudomonadales bacterium]HJN49961.1 heat-inducible transcriptional repressor HrcA [Pseudomonadales bacterium]|tara:strand:+ start:255 stop:1295 length:1041 start_codon:yes stop_codon:yes gene_type:complete
MKKRSVDSRAQQLLKALVESYIKNGQPVGSRTLVDQADLSVSPATARNIMADLEEKGLIMSPHTSAGRVPTPLGYRFFVDSLVKVKPLDSIDLEHLSRGFNPDMSSQQLVESASGLLSDVTQMAGVVTLPKREHATLRYVEFLRLSANRVLTILVLDEHEVHNRIIYTSREYAESQLKEAANFINQSFAGQSLNSIRKELISSMQSDRENMNSLMQTTLEVASQAFNQESASDYVVAGQEKLIETARTQALENIRSLFQAFSLKGDILHLLDRCMESQGVQLFIGEESGYKVLDECSVVTAPYHVEGDRVGVLGIIGPTRMAYEKVIPIVDATAKILSEALDASIR